MSITDSKNKKCIGVWGGGGGQLSDVLWISKLSNLKMATKQTIKDIALKLFCGDDVLYPDDCTTGQVCVIMVGREGILNTNISYFSRLS